MRKYFFPAALLLLFLQAFQNPVATLHLHLDGIKSARGVIRIYLFNNPDNFPVKKDLAFRKITLSPGKADDVELKNIPYGTYALSIFQDLNNNGKMDRTWFGMPGEPYAVSGRPVVRFGPPWFSDCSFRIDRPDVYLNLKIKD